MNQRGQSLIETAIFFLVLAPLISMLLGFTAWFQVREKLILATWEAAQLYSSGCMAKQEVNQRIRAFLTTGTPTFEPNGIQITMGPVLNPAGIIYQLDKISIVYTAPRRWHALLNLSQTLEETCTIAHAPHYWDPLMENFPVPNAPPIHGPVYPWRQ